MHPSRSKQGHQKSQSLDAVPKDSPSETVGKDLANGNPAGLSLFKKLQQISEEQARQRAVQARQGAELARHGAELARHGAELARHGAELARHGAELASQRMEFAQLRDVISACEGYHEIRHRFLDVYKRDILGKRLAAPRESIRNGSTRTHAGDAITDAEMYVNGMRNDNYLMIEIYGISAERVLELASLDNHASISVFDKIATLKADPGVQIPEELVDAFEIFRRILLMDTKKKPNQDIQSALGKACSHFWHLCRTL